MTPDYMTYATMIGPRGLGHIVEGKYCVLD